MQILAALIGFLLVAGVLRDAFETIILPRRVSGVRISKVFYRASWRPWAAIARRLPPSDNRETFLSVYGPLSLLVLIVLWAVVLVSGFALLLWAANYGAPVAQDNVAYKPRQLQLGFRATFCAGRHPFSSGNLS